MIDISTKEPESIEKGQRELVRLALWAQEKITNETWLYIECRAEFLRAWLRERDALESARPVLSQMLEEEKAA